MDLHAPEETPGHKQPQEPPGDMTATPSVLQLWYGNHQAPTFNSPQIAASCWVCFYFASPSPVAFEQMPVLLPGWVSKQQSVTSGICKPGLKEDGHAPSW